jgi:hypothetical protein
MSSTFHSDYSCHAVSSRSLSQRLWDGPVSWRARLILNESRSGGHPCITIKEIPQYQHSVVCHPWMSDTGFLQQNSRYRCPSRRHWYPAPDSSAWSSHQRYIDCSRASLFGVSWMDKSAGKYHLLVLGSDIFKLIGEIHFRLWACQTDHRQGSRVRGRHIPGFPRLVSPPCLLQHLKVYVLAWDDW